MIPKDCKRLAEVDFPIAVVSRHSVREKSGPKGHPSALHLWWARRPLAACRAVLLGLLLPDPLDALCPEEFKRAAHELLKKVPGSGAPSTDKGLQRALLRFIGDFASWDLAANATYLEVGRGLIRAAHPDEPPTVVDPFAGGGSIPLEALRLGCDTFASDLNPVASLVLKGLLEDIPRHSSALAQQLPQVGSEFGKALESELGGFYPVGPDGARPIAYIWARTARCESPGCGTEIPLARSFWLGKNEVSRSHGKKRIKIRGRQALRPHVVQRSEGPPHVEFEIIEPSSAGDVVAGTVRRANATCLACRAVLAPDRVVAQLRDQKGGADVVFDSMGRRTAGTRLLAVVTVKQGEPGKHYRLPSEEDYGAVYRATRRLEETGAKRLPRGLTQVPDELLPPIGTLGFRVQRYGMLKWGDLFSARQKLALLAVRNLIADGVPADSPLARLLAFGLSRVAMSDMSCTRWNAVGEKMQHTFGRQALPIVWDFAEVVPTAEAPGNWKSAYEIVAEVVSAWPGSNTRAQVQVADACESPLVPGTASVWFTDPPYYDAVPYADLSDFFFVWLKRVLPGHPFLQDLNDASNSLTPKSREIVQDETKRVQGRAKGRAFFEEAMALAFAEGRRILKDDGIGSVVFAHKTTEGWEALLSGMIRGGWTITASWPIATEMSTRLRARESAALATSVHLVCRRRPDGARIGDWADVLRELPNRVRSWMERLQSEGIRGADLVFACIGPALEIYSRYSKVVDPEEREIPLGGNPEATLPHERGYLAYVWETVGRAALEQVLGAADARARNGASGAIEEDARLTALFLWTVQSTNGQGEASRAEVAGDEEEELEDDYGEGGSRRPAKGFSLVFDVVRRFAQPLGIHLPDWEERIIEIEKGVVRLLPVSERAKQLFGEEGAHVAADLLEEGPKASPQLRLFPEQEQPVEPTRPRRRSRPSTDKSDFSLRPRREATTLDRIHAAMLLQAAGRANALRTLLNAEQDQGPDFLRLANALSALYPKDSEEKRLLDAMLLVVPR